MLRTWQQCVSLVAGMCMALGVSAQTLTMASPSPYQWVIEGGWNDGGDKMADGNYVNTGKPWEIRAGKGVQGGVGLQYAFNDQWATQFTMSYTVDSTNGTNGDAAFKRSPAEWMLIHNLNDRWRVGVGWHQSFSAKRTNTGVAALLGTENFKADSGAVVQLMYFFKPYTNYKLSGSEINAGLGLRYVTEQFTSEKTTRVYRADHGGLFLGLYF